MASGSAPAPALDLSARQYDILDKEQNKATCGRRQHQRINIILLASQGKANKEIVRLLNISLTTVKKWRSRWQVSYPKLQAYEKGADGNGISDSALRKKMLELLKDQTRSGAPVVISLAQKEQIVALACENPKDYGIIKTDWTLPDLCQVAIEKQIVPSITSVYIGRLLKNKRVTTA